MFKVIVNGGRKECRVGIWRENEGPLEPTRVPQCRRNGIWRENEGPLIPN